MPQSLSNVLLHIVFSTKHRHAWIDAVIENELFPYVATICREHKCFSHQVGVTDDHIHIACSLSRTITVADLVQELKQSTSKWIKTKGTKYQNFAGKTGTVLSPSDNHSLRICADTSSINEFITLRNRFKMSTENC